jgi:predicted phosphodiesterase
MKVAALYDIHANLPALEAVLEEVRAAAVDHVVIGGDVLPGPMPHETLERLQRLDVPVSGIHGNGELALLAQLAVTDPSEVTYWGTTSGAPPPMGVPELLRWAARDLRPDEARVIKDWPKTITLHVAGLGDVLFCHGTPTSETDAFTHLTPEDVLVPVFQGLGVSLVVCGHTHMQFDRWIGETRVINAGSVGMPFGTTGAYWSLLGPDVQLRHTQYDLEAAADRIRATPYPQAREFAESILNPASEAAILEQFTRISF